MSEPSLDSRQFHCAAHSGRRRPWYYHVFVIVLFVACISFRISCVSLRGCLCSDSLRPHCSHRLALASSIYGLSPTKAWFENVELASEAYRAASSELSSIRDQYLLEKPLGVLTALQHRVVEQLDEYWSWLACSLLGHFRIHCSMCRWTRHSERLQRQWS